MTITTIPDSRNICRQAQPGFDILSVDSADQQLLVQNSHTAWHIGSLIHPAANNHNPQGDPILYNSHTTSSSRAGFQ
jgi:hypothetical protein